MVLWGDGVLGMPATNLIKGEKKTRLEKEDGFDPTSWAEKTSRVAHVI